VKSNGGRGSDETRHRVRNGRPGSGSRSIPAADSRAAPARPDHAAIGRTDQEAEELRVALQMVLDVQVFDSAGRAVAVQDVLRGYIAAAVRVALERCRGR
jgi:hypothetical protein